jgi:hypothetical protein
MLPRRALHGPKIDATRLAPIFQKALNYAVMNTALRVLAIALLLFCAGGCASSDESQNPNASAIPWNRPQSWEGQGMLGGFNPGPQGSTGH